MSVDWGDAVPRWYYGWNVIAVAIVFQGVTFGIGLFCFTFFIQPWIDEFHTGRAELLSAVMAATLAIGIFGPFAGKAMDKFPIRLIVAAGGALFALGLALLSQATAVWHIIVIYGVVIGGGLVLAGSIAAQTLAAKWFRGRRGLAVGLVTIGTSAGGFLTPPLTAYLIATYDWRTTCLVLAAISAVAVIPLSLLVIRNSPEEAGIEPDPESDRSRASASHFASMSWTTKSIALDRAFLITILAFLPMSIVQSALQQNLAPLTFDLGVEAQKASGLMSVLAAMMVLGKIAFGAASDRIDNRYLFWIEAGLIMAVVVMFMGQPSYFEMVIMCGILGAASGGTLPLLGSIIGQRYGPKFFGQAMGLLMPFLTVSSLGVVVTGRVRDTTGSYDLALMAFLVIMVPAVLSMAALPKLRRPAAAEQPAQ